MSKSRIEQFLEALLTDCGCNIKPLSRTEAYLKAILEKGGVSGGSGGGSGSSGVGVVPFTNVKMTRIVRQTFSKDADGKYPAYVSITEDDNGNPLELTAFAVKSDVKSGNSKTAFGITPTVGNRMAAKGAWGIPKSHGADAQLAVVLINKDGRVLYFTQGQSGYHTESCVYSMSDYKARELFFPSDGGISSGSYIEVWKLEIDE